MRGPKLIAAAFLLLIVSNVKAQEITEIEVNKEYFGKVLKNIFTDHGESYNLDMDFNPEDVKSGIVKSRWYRNKNLTYVHGG